MWSEIDESNLNNSNMYIRELKILEFKEWINSIDKPNEEKKLSMGEKEEENNMEKEFKEFEGQLKEMKKGDKNHPNYKKKFLLIYKDNILKFKLILNSGIIKSLKYIPIIKNSGIKFYDVYFVESKNNNNK